MGIFSRVSDIVSANLNEMVEKFEDPEKMLKQAVREMDASIEQARQSTARAAADEKMIGRELEKNRSGAKLWADRAETAVADGNDDLARKALARKREHEKVTTALEDQLAAAEQSTQTLRRQLEAMQAKLADAKRRLGTLTARKRAADLRSRMSEAPSAVTLQTDAFAKFDRMQQKVEMAEAEAEAMRELTGQTEADESVGVAIEPDVDAEVEAEVAALKKKLGR